MSKWRCEPGHTAVEFAVRHMMVTFVRGYFKNIRGEVDFDPSNPTKSALILEIDAFALDTGERERDAHLRSPDFFDVEKHPKIIFTSTRVELISATEAKVVGDLTIRGVKRSETFDVRFLGISRTPFKDTRVGFLATGEINRHNYGVSWNSVMEGGGVVGSDVSLTIDIEAILTK